MTASETKSWDGTRRAAKFIGVLDGLHRFELGHVVSEYADVLLFYGGDVDGGRRWGGPSRSGRCVIFATACQ